MVDKNKVCKHCKQLYKDHVNYIMDVWDDDYEKRFEAYEPSKPDICNRFSPMSNLELLEWEVNKRERDSK